MYALTEDLLTASDELYAWRAEMRLVMEGLYFEPAFDDASDVELLEESRRRVGSAPLEATTRFMDRLTDIYLEGTPEQQEHIRSAMSIDIVMLNFVHTFIFEMTQQIKGPDDAQLFRRAVAAASIEENRVDSNTMTLLLNELVARAKASGINVDDHLNEIADYTNTERSGRSFGYSMQEFIRSYVGK